VGIKKWNGTEFTAYGLTSRILLVAKKTWKLIGKQSFAGMFILHEDSKGKES
jgi:hypothetical protein